MTVKDKVPEILFDPLQFGQEILVVFVSIVVIWLLIIYRQRVIFVLTGDPWFHVNILDCLWGCIRCCGLCRGEWTRCITRLPCFRGTNLYGRNLVQSIGQLWGFASHSVEIKNIVVGDLPFKGRRGDFYISIECQTNPAMVTALQEDKFPKVVHFPEVLTLRIRNNYYEDRVRICVRELNVVGHQDVCEVFLAAEALIDWKEAPDRTKRFQMRAMDNSFECETPPWICMDITEPEEAREIDHIQQSRLTPFVRTWATSDRNITQVGGNEHQVSVNRTIQDQSMRDFKRQEILVDDAGNPIQEPDEGVIYLIRRCRTCVLGLFHFFNTLVLMAVFTFVCFRFYVWSCYRQFRWMTMAKMNGAVFPISRASLRKIVDACKAATEGTGQAEGVPCRPNFEEVLEVCQNEPAGQRPKAFASLLYRITGFDITAGIPCFHGVCKLRDELVKYDVTVAVVAVLLLLMLCTCRYLANQSIKRYKRNVQRKHGEHVRQGLLGRA